MAEPLIDIWGQAAPADGPVLDVRDLRVRFATDDGVVKAVDGVSFTVERGRTLGIVGESGSGKSVTSMAIMGLHTGKNVEITGEIRLDGEDLIAASRERVRQLRGQQMAMIFQDPLSSLHPYYTVGHQIIEAYRVHNKVSRQAARRRAIDLLGRVGIPQPAVRVDDYPHQFSGGMRQRAMIAMALSCDPDLLIADEPTTALDVTVQAQILDLILDLQEEFRSAVIIITHDLGVVAEVSDQILVMYAGRQVETGSAFSVFSQPRHPYTWGLLGSMPRLDIGRAERLIPIPGTPPSLINVPSGCPFHPRCGYQVKVEGERCVTEVPVLLEVASGDGALDHRAACHLPADLKRSLWAGLSDPLSRTSTPPVPASADSGTVDGEAAGDAAEGGGAASPGSGDSAGFLYSGDPVDAADFSDSADSASEGEA
jgi:peptide/nickel transport system ATP-binding protein